MEWLTTFLTGIANILLGILALFFDLFVYIFGSILQALTSLLHGGF